jgi:hypothetical protein
MFMNTLYISAWRSVAFPGFAAPVCGFKHAALSQYAKNELERAALLHYSNSYAYTGRVYCICVVVFGCVDCEDF